MVLLGYLRCSQVQVVIDHLEGGVAKNTAQREDVAAVGQVAGSKGMAAEVGMQPLDAAALCQRGKQQLDAVDSQGLAAGV